VRDNRGEFDYCNQVFELSKVECDLHKFGAWWQAEKFVLGSGGELSRLESGGDIGTRKRRRALAALATLENEHRNSPGRQPGDAPTPRRRTTNARAK
jgi:hypothetical protein